MRTRRPAAAAFARGVKPHVAITLIRNVIVLLPKLSAAFANNGFCLAKPGVPICSHYNQANKATLITIITTYKNQILVT